VTTLLKWPPDRKQIVHKHIKSYLIEGQQSMISINLRAENEGRYRTRRAHICLTIEVTSTTLSRFGVNGCPSSLASRQARRSNVR
jgi:hypothetical protein